MLDSDVELEHNVTQENEVDTDSQTDVKLSTTAVWVHNNAINRSAHQRGKKCCANLFALGYRKCYLTIGYMNNPATIYDAVTAEITSAGFFVLPPNANDPFPRICPATKYQIGRGYSGNSFWIANVGKQWFLGTWGGMLYLVPASDQVGRFTIEWFKHKPQGTASDFDPWIVQKYHLQPFDNDEFDKLFDA